MNYKGYTIEQDLYRFKYWKVNEFKWSSAKTLEECKAEIDQLIEEETSQRRIGLVCRKCGKTFTSTDPDRKACDKCRYVFPK